MCGLSGILLERKRRRRGELEEIGALFTELLLLNQARGRNAAGLAVIRRDGSFSLFKRPGPAARLVVEGKYAEIVGGLDNRATCILGHTRRKTRGSEANSLNNMPLRAGDVIGVHNGTILNADALFRKHRLPRAAEVDSEFLFRLADARKDEESFTACLKDVQGWMSAVFTRLSEPGAIYAIKGNKPLALWRHKKFRAVFFSSEAWPLERVFGGSLKDVEPVEIEPFTLSIFDVADLTDVRRRDIRFGAASRSVGSWRFFPLSSTAAY